MFIKIGKNLEVYCFNPHNGSESETLNRIIVFPAVFVFFIFQINFQYVIAFFYIKNMCNIY
jgi:hypothetical protein